MALEAGTAFVNVEGNFQALRQGIQREGDAAAQSLGRRISQGFSRIGGQMQSAGQKLTTRLTLPIVGLGVGILKVAGDFQSSMNQVRAVTGATGAELDGLSGLAKELGRTTQFSASQAADAMYFLASAGFDTNEIMEALPGTLQLAAAANMDLATAADIASNILSGYGMEADELARVNDVLVATFQATNTNVTQLGEAMKFVAPIASGAGVQFEEATAALGLMGNAGIQASLAGTSLRGAITRLLEPTAAVQERLDELGVSALDSDGNLRSLEDIVKQLEDSGASTADMMAIFGLRAGPAMAALVAEGHEALGELTGELEDSGGVAEHVADVQMEGLNGAMARLKSALEGVAIAIAESGLIDWAADLADKASDLFTNLAESNPELLRIGTIVAGVLAGAGPVLFIVGAGLSAIGTLLSPAGLVLGGLAALGVGLGLAHAEGDTLTEKLGDLAERIQEGVVTGFGDMVTSWKHDLKPVFADIGEGLDGLDIQFNGFTEGFLNFGFNVSQLTGIIGAAAQTAIQMAETFALASALITGNEEAAQAARERIADAEIAKMEAVSLANEDFTEFHERMQRTQRAEELETRDVARFAGQGRRDAMGRIVADHAGATEALRGLGGQQRDDLAATREAVGKTSARFDVLGGRIRDVPRSVSVATSSPGATRAARELRAVGDDVRGIGKSVSTVRTAINMSFEARRELRGLGDGLGIPVPAMRGVGDGLGVKAEATTRVSVTKQIERLLGLGGGRVAGAVGALMGALRGRFPRLALISGFRPGARTLSGALSYHARGRAVDVPPLRAVAEFIRSRFGAATKELITPWRELDLHNGRSHRYSAAVHRQHNFAGGNAHVHWAMADGGIVRQPVHALIGEAGPEAVVPLGGGGDLIDYDRLARAIAAMSPTEIRMDGDRVAETLRRREVARS